MKFLKFLIPAALSALVIAFTANAAVGPNSVIITDLGTPSTNVAIGTTRAHLLDFSLETIDEEIAIESIPVVFKISDDSTNEDAGFLNLWGFSNIYNVRIVDVDTGATVAGPIDAEYFTTYVEGTLFDMSEEVDSGYVSYFEFNDTFYLEPGPTLNLAVVAGITGNVDLIDSTLKAGLVISDNYPVIRDQSTGSLIVNSTDLQPSTSFWGDPITFTP